MTTALGAGDSRSKYLRAYKALDVSLRGKVDRNPVGRTARSDPNVGA